MSIISQPGEREKTTQSTNLEIYMIVTVLHHSFREIMRSAFP
jgi:hypothetical protein